MAKVSHIVLPVSDIQKSREWYVNKLGFTLERERDEAVGIKDESGSTIFLLKTGDFSSWPENHSHDSGRRRGQQAPGTCGAGCELRQPTQAQFWGYGAEVLDPDGYMNHVWDKATMAKAMREMSGKSD